ncbi:hypothetical protein [Burkholderia contaminans]|uniref:hypothetical protein n=1 Tax=Burkholderia contaminans TaxID=488447 RepID=UPI00158899ED|nr:hypothetical protein [Burkholderia contaminans]
MNTELRETFEAIRKERESWRQQTKQAYVNPHKQTLEEFVAKPVRQTHYIDLMTDAEQMEKLAPIINRVSISEQKEFAKLNELKEFGVNPDLPVVQEWKKFREDNGLSFTAQPGQINVHNKDFSMISTVRGNDPLEMVSDSLEAIKSTFKKSKADNLVASINHEATATQTSTAKKGLTA